MLGRSFLEWVESIQRVAYKKLKTSSRATFCINPEK